MTFSCYHCRRRKVKCDKKVLCTPCGKAGLSCTYQQRVDSVKSPRKRLQSEESSDVLAGSSSHQAGAFEQASVTDHQAPPAAHNIRNFDDRYALFVESQQRPRLTNNTFWNQLHEKTGLADGSLLSRTTNEHVGATEHDPIKFVFGSGNDGASVAQARSKDHADVLPVYRSALLQFFFARVHPICRILHHPTAVSCVQELESLTNAQTNRLKYNSLEALYCAIAFSALQSLTASECRAELGVEKELIEPRLRQDLESSLAACGLSNTRELGTLQAFTLYIVGMYSGQSTQSTWALLGLAVRISQGMGLHRDGQGTAWNPFVAEMRRRLWWQLVALDVLLSNDRGTEPLISAHTFTVPRPLNIDDSNINYDSLVAVPDRPSMADMTLPLAYMDGLDVLRTINLTHESTEARADLATAFSERMESRYRRSGDDAVEVDLNDSRTWLTYMSVHLLSLMMWLSVQYPLHSRIESTHGFSQRHALKTAVTLLELKQRIDESALAAPFQWWFRMIEPWHALAIALSILCTGTKDDVVDLAWPIVNKAYDRFSERFDGDSHVDVWFPLQSLMVKAQQRQQTHSSNPSMPIQPSINRSVHAADASASSTSSSITDSTLAYQARFAYATATPALTVNMWPGDGEIGSGEVWDDWNAFVDDLSYLNPTHTDGVAEPSHP